jgi:predicted Zn-ribbon and HTH transcriptional regulator
MAEPSHCPKCAAAMEPGFMLDWTVGGYLVTEWMEGEPEKSFWTGLKLNRRRRLKVVAWRCRRCGFLESYAP